MTGDPPIAPQDELAVQACYRLIESLRESESRYQRLLDISIDGFWERDAASGATYLSPRWKALAGYDDAELANGFDTFVDLIDPADRGRVLGIIEAHRMDPEGYVTEFRLQHKSGQVVWIKMRGKTVFGPDGRAQLLCGSAVDISREKAMENALTESERRLNFALEGSSQGAWDWNLKTGSVFFSPRWRARLGYRDGQPEDTAPAWEALIHPDDQARVRLCIRRYLVCQSEGFEVEFRQRTGDGTYRWIQARGTIVETDDAGTPARMIGTHADIDDRKQAEERLRLAAAVIEHAKEAIVTTDADNRILAVNPAFTAMTGYTPDDALGQDPCFLSAGRQSRSHFRKMWESLNNTGAWEGEVWNRRKNGEIYPQWLSISLIRDGNGRVTHHIGVASDNTDRNAVQERLEHLAHYDTLTRLPNRMLVRDRLQQAVRSARRQNSTLAVLFVDLDRFKIINDSLGHHVGDTLLQSVAERVLACVREMDTVGRHGGDEFIVVLPEVDRLAAELIAERIVESLSTPFFLCDHELAISSSVGVALFPGDGDDVDTLIQNADTAMYHAKQTGRANVRFFANEMSLQANRQLEMAEGLRRALASNQFVLHYQPQVDLATGRILALEALVRWRTPQGLLMPASFLGIAAQNGLIGPIDEWVMTHACRQMKTWQASGVIRSKLAVNVSASRLSEKDFVRRVSDILSAAGLEANQLELEITERTTVESAEAAAGAIVALRKVGISVAIDDFGAGYASMSYLKSFRVDKLKIDRCFVDGLPKDPDSAAIADAIINLGTKMGLVVIAKGVENRAQLDYLVTRGLKVAEGRIFGDPLPAQGFARQLMKGGKLTFPPSWPGGPEGLTADRLSY